MSFSQYEYVTKKITAKISIDGEVNEAVWDEVESATDFTTQSPVFCKLSEFQSDVRVVYDDEAIYVGGRLYDRSPDSVSYSLSTRDDLGNADWVGVSIDTYGNMVNAFGFMLTSAGVQVDILEGINNIDNSWNAVWKSAVKRQDFGWSFEMKIPYSAIRFPNKEIQDWNINFFRNVRRTRETSTWSPVDPQIFGEITQSGKLRGVRDIKSPMRLSFTPYLTGYMEDTYDDGGNQGWNYRLTGGMDLKLGLNDAFTLDMTIIPDFGQTTSDNQVLNLGPFEVRYNENRPFFIEGTELFRIGGIFYSRRIGGTPFNYWNAFGELDEGESVESSPSVAQMINGTKISGRTSKGLGLGLFNALEASSEATIVDSLGNRRTVETNPLTNYNVFVASQNLKNNSVVSFVNTNVMRDGSNRDANVSSFSASIFSEDGMFRISPYMKVSAKFEELETVLGHSMGTSIQKVSGTWQYGVSYNEESETYDPNDLGFLYNNNSRSYGANISWNTIEPTKNFYRRNVNLGWYYSELYRPQLYNYTGINWTIGGLHKKQVYMNVSGNIAPFGSYNHFESRRFGKEVYFYPNADAGYFFTTDYSKVFALDGRVGFTNYFGVEQYNWSLWLSPRIRISDRWNVILRASYNSRINDYGYVAAQDEAYYDVILLGTRNRQIVENTIRSEFIFTKNMGVDLRLRHYWQQVEYIDFNELLDEGETRPTDYFPSEENGQSSHNTSYNAFTLDVNFRWVFLPGSELRVVYKNNLFHSKSFLDETYFNTFETLFDQPQLNSISLKALFFIDALYFKRKAKK